MPAPPSGWRWLAPRRWPPARGQQAQRLLSGPPGLLTACQLPRRGVLRLNPRSVAGGRVCGPLSAGRPDQHPAPPAGGQYEIDDYGRDQGFIDVVLPLMQFLYRSYWRVTVSGIEHVPQQGRALLVANHSGVLPFDGAMPHRRLTTRRPASACRGVGQGRAFPTLPFVSILLHKTVNTPAHPSTALRLLEQEEWVVVFPEGTKGVGKPFHQRYQLQRFGRGGFIKVALQAGAPIIP